MCYKGVTEENIEKKRERRQNELKHPNLHLHNTLNLPERLHKI